MNNYTKLAEGVMRHGLNIEPLTIHREMKGFVSNLFQVPEKPELFMSPEVMALPQRVCVPVTGGLDSTLLYFKIKRDLAVGVESKRESIQIHTAYYDFGQSYAYKEIDALQRLGIPLSNHIDRRDMTNGGIYWKHILPGRNFYILASLAENHMPQGGVILFGAVDGEMPTQGGDKSKRFFAQLNTLFAALPYPVIIECPFQNMTKTDLVEWWLRSGGEKEILVNTVSCFNAEWVMPWHCGECQACLRKWLAFACNNIELKTEVPVKLGCVEYIEKYNRVLNEALNTGDFTKYSQRRCEQDLKGLALL